METDTSWLSDRVGADNVADAEGLLVGEGERETLGSAVTVTEGDAVADSYDFDTGLEKLIE